MHRFMESIKNANIYNEYKFERNLEIVEDKELLKSIKKKILITGSTGLIGQAIIKKIQHYNDSAVESIKIVAMVRNQEKAEELFGKENDCLQYLVGDVMTIQPQNLSVDYIIHAASQTSSKTFINEPVETIMTAFTGTKNMLELAKANPVKGFAYLSTMEVYGSLATDEKIGEEHNTNLDAMKVRSCYPESKRMCESLCASYASEYGVPIKVIRLTQTFGPGVKYNDGRVFAEFARCAIEEKDIVLNTKGETKRNYLYTEDAVDAILAVLVNGEVGEAYNAANEDTYCSIYEMACMVAEKCADGKINVRINDQGDAAQRGYAPTLKMNLDTRKLQALGWKPQVGLEEMFNKMLEDMKSQIG